MFSFCGLTEYVLGLYKGLILFLFCSNGWFWTGLKWYPKFCLGFCWGIDCKVLTTYCGFIVMISFSFVWVTSSFFSLLSLSNSPSFDFDLLLPPSNEPSRYAPLFIIFEELEIELLSLSKILFLLDLVTLFVEIIWGWITFDSWRSFFCSTSKLIGDLLFCVKALLLLRWPKAFYCFLKFMLTFCVLLLSPNKLFPVLYLFPKFSSGSFNL